MRSILIAAMVVSAVGVAIQSAAAPKADDAIKHVFAQLDDCIANNDAKCVGELLVEDATFVAPTAGAKIIKGKAEIVKTLQDLLKGAPNMKGAKQTHSVENVRMIGPDHAVVDAALEMKRTDGGAGEAPRDSYHAVAVMVLKGDKWLYEDLRSYAVEAAQAAKKPATTTPTTLEK